MVKLDLWIVSYTFTGELFLNSGNTCVERSVTSLVHVSALRCLLGWQSLRLFFISCFSMRETLESYQKKKTGRKFEMSWKTLSMAMGKMCVGFSSKEGKRWSLGPRFTCWLLYNQHFSKYIVIACMISDLAGVGEISSKILETLMMTLSNMLWFVFSSCS